MTYRALVAIFLFLLTIATAQEAAQEDAANNSTSQTSNSTATEAEEEDKYADYSFDCLKNADGEDILGNT